MTPLLLSVGVLSLKTVCMHECVCECVRMCSCIEGALKVKPLPTPETGNGSNMGLSVAFFKALGSDLGLSGPELQDQRAKMYKVKNTDVFSEPLKTLENLRQEP